MLEEILAYNKKFVEDKGYEAYITNKYPDKKIAILSCMDTRLTALLPAAHGRGIQAHDPGYRLTQRIHDLRQTLRVHRVYGIERRPKIKAVEALSHLDSRDPVRGKDTILLPRLLRKLPLPSGDSA